jgi:hypothetical protein
MEKYEREAKEAGRESWYLSWALDSTPQERAKVRHSCRWVHVWSTATDCGHHRRTYRARRSKWAGLTLRRPSDDTRSSTHRVTRTLFLV